MSLDAGVLDCIWRPHKSL